MRRYVVAAVALLGCTSVERGRVESFEQKPALSETIVARSAPGEPTWLEPRQVVKENGVVFVGEGAATDVAAARTAARANLFSTISTFVAVDVTAELEDFASSDGTNLVTQTVTERSDTTLRNVAPDAAYWEQVLASPLLPDDNRYRFLMRAFVPRTEIARARAQAQARREKDTGAPSLAVLPFDLAFGDAPTLAPALWEALTARLSDMGAWRVADPKMVHATYPGGQDEAAARARVMDALLPDFVVSGTAQRHGDHVRLTLTVHDGKDGRPLSTEVGTAKTGEVQDMIGTLAGRIREKHGDGSDEPPATSLIVSLDALRLYAEAQGHFARGALDEATAVIRRGIALQDDDPRGWMRLGRILERRGHFARLPSVAATSAAPTTQVPVACTPEGRDAIVAAERRIDERRKQYETGGEARVWWKDSTADIDQVLTEASRVLLAGDQTTNRCGQCPMGTFCDPLSGICMPSCLRIDYCGSRETCTANGICACKDGQCGADAGRRKLELVDSAAEAYLAALVRTNHDRRHVEAGLALADLAVRVDRYDEAAAFYTRIDGWASQKKDLHIRSLAKYGLGVLARQRGRFAEAKQHLLAALAARGRLGEKPYLLEIYNELGTVSIELGKPDDASRFYARALMLARDLGQDYVRAILDNNVGVLDVAEGEVATARERFDRAFTTLRDLGDSEGQLSAVMNLGFVATLRGDPIAADTRLGDAEQLVEASGQEGRRAQWLAQRGSTRAKTGRAAEALGDLAESGLLAGRLGRNVDAQKRVSDFIVAEQRLAPPTAELIACHAQTFAGRGTPVFAANDREQVVQTIADLPAGSVQLHDLVAALNAAVLAAQTSWRPEQVRYTHRPQPTASPQRQTNTALEALRRLHGLLVGNTPMDLDLRAPDRRYNDFQMCLAREMLAFVKIARDAYRAKASGARDDLWKLLGVATTEPYEMCGMRRPDLVRPDRGVPPMPSSPGQAAEVAEEDVVVVLKATGRRRRAKPKPAAARFEKAPEYERILGAATVAPDLLLLLDPAGLAEHRAWRPKARHARRMVEALVDHFAAAKIARYEAAARLNHGALLWFEFQPKRAYRELMTAREIYARMGDAEGLARTYEWLGYVLNDSLEPELAADHLAFAKHLYERQDDEDSAKRILSYTD